MGKNARLNLGSVLIKAGFDARKVLKLIGYPTCVSISLIASPGVANSIFAVTSDSRIQYDLIGAARPKALNPKLISYLDHIEQSGNNVYQFSFSDGTQTKILAEENLTIPGPPGWPQIDFLQPKYPIPVS